MPFARSLKLLACLTLAAGAAQTAHAIPVTYQFTTGALGSSPFTPQPVFGPSAGVISSALTGLSVSGSFAYDSETPLTSVTNGPIVFNQSNYENAITSFSGSVGTLNFTASTGKMDVANEGYQSNADFLQLVAITDKGISLANLPLITARLFWIENASSPFLPAAPDFLTGNDLPASLPTLSGRFALDFLDKDALGNVAITTALFDGLTVTAAPAPAPVPEPATLGLLLSCSTLLGMVRRQRRQAT